MYRAPAFAPRLMTQDPELLGGNAMPQALVSRLQQFVAQQMQQAALARAPRVGGPQGGVPTLAGGLPPQGLQAAPSPGIPDMGGVSVSPGGQPGPLRTMPADPTATAPRVGQVAQRKPVSVGRTIADVLWKGESPYDSMDAQRARAAQAEQQQALQAQIADLVQQTGMEPREALTFLTNREEWSKQNAERYGVQNVAPNATVNYGDPGAGGESFTAPGAPLQPQLFHDSNGDVSQFLPNEDGSGYTGGQLYDAPEPVKPPRTVEAQDGLWEEQPNGSWKRVATFAPQAKVFAPRASKTGAGAVPGAGGSSTLDAIGAELRRRGILK